MDPLQERRLRDEVIYLHSLWHQGPPRPAAPPHSLPPSNTAHFKKEGKNRGRRGRKFNSRLNSIAPDPKTSPGKEWDCPTPPPEAPSTWVSSGDQPSSSSHIPTPEDQPKFTAKKAQQKAMETVREFLKYNHSDGESDPIDSDGEEDCDDDECREYTFFLKVFTEDAELKEYCMKNFARGEFSCLVCGAIGGKNSGKKFKGCLPLVQHSITIGKTKYKRAHRAYGQAVCKVLSWDIDRLPAIVSLLSDSGEAQRNANFDKTENSISVIANLESGVPNHVEAVTENVTLDSELGDKQGNANFDKTENSISLLRNSESGDSNQGEAVTENVALGSELGDKHGNVDFDKAENSVSVSGNLESGDHNHIEVLTENVTLGGELVLNADEGIMPSSGAAVGNNSLEDECMLQPGNEEETVADRLSSASNSLLVADANHTLEVLGVVHPSNVGITVENSWSYFPSSVAIYNLEDPSMVHSSVTAEISTRELPSGPLDEKDGVGTCAPTLHGQKEEDKTED